MNPVFPFYLVLLEGSFVFELFYDAVSVSDHIASNGKMTDDELEGTWKEAVVS
jgi:hypothetical protein